MLIQLWTVLNGSWSEFNCSRKKKILYETGIAVNIPMALKFIVFLGCISLLFAADYTSSLFDFVGFVNPSDNFLALTIVRNQLGCFSACIGNNNCYFFDYCGNSSPTSCFLYDRSINSSDNTVYTKGPCQRYKLVSISHKAHNWNKFQKRMYWKMLFKIILNNNAYIVFFSNPTINVHINSMYRFPKSHF